MTKTTIDLKEAREAALQALAAEGDALVESLRQQVAESEGLREMLLKNCKQVLEQRDEARQQRAERDAVIERARAYVATWRTQSVARIELVAILDAAPSTALDAVKADAWEECIKAFAWCLQNGPADDAVPYVDEHNPYRNEADHDE